MSEHTTNNHEYIDHYPDAISNPEQAHLMAAHTNLNRTHAAQHRRSADLYREVSVLGEDHIEDRFKRVQNMMLSRVMDRIRNDEINNDEGIALLKSIVTPRHDGGRIPYDLRVEEWALSLQEMRRTGRAKEVRVDVDGIFFTEGSKPLLYSQFLRDRAEEEDITANRKDAEIAALFNERVID